MCSRIALALSLGMMVACGGTQDAPASGGGSQIEPEEAAARPTPPATPVAAPERPATRWSRLRCRSSQSYNYETATIEWGEDRISIELGAGTNLFLDGKVEWGSPTPTLRALSASLPPSSCDKRGDRERELLCKVQGGDGSVISVGESPDRMQRANIATARLFVATQGEGPNERIEIQAEATGTGGESAQTTVRFGPGDCTRE